MQWSNRWRIAPDSHDVTKDLIGIGLTRAQLSADRESLERQLVKNPFVVGESRIDATERVVFTELFLRYYFVVLAELQTVKILDFVDPKSP